MRRTPLKKLGKVGKRRIKVSRELTAEAKANGYDFCEIGAVMRDWEIDTSPCFGFPLQNCHSVKCSPRGSDPILDRETGRGCPHHHAIMDSKTHKTQASVVREAIRRRTA